jgi:rhodanese-related sulfurtransferase
MRNARFLVLEAVLVAGLGLAFALAANALSARGLRLGRNYFPGGTSPSPTTNSVIGPVVSNALAAAPVDGVLQRLQHRGLQLVTSNEVAALFREPGYEQGLVIFVDARDDRNYQSGHIPGAWQLDHYRAENYLPIVLPACLGAQKVVVYCSGGACEDSEFAAIMLRDTGVRGESLFVYAGGITEWTNNRLPVEIGARGSGQLLMPAP